MINFEDIKSEKIKEHNPNWPQMPDYSYRILIIEGFGSGYTNALLKLISHQSDVDKIFSYANDPYEAKCNR